MPYVAWPVNLSSRVVVVPAMVAELMQVARLARVLGLGRTRLCLGDACACVERHGLLQRTAHVPCASFCATWALPVV